MLSGFPGNPMTLQISCSVALPCELKDDSASQRSSASSV